MSALTFTGDGLIQRSANQFAVLDASDRGIEGGGQARQTVGEDLWPADYASLRSEPSLSKMPSQVH